MADIWAISIFFFLLYGSGSSKVFKRFECKGLIGKRRFVLNIEERNKEF